jgi:hypothetical protein
MGEPAGLPMPCRRHDHDLDFGRRLSGNHWRLAGAFTARRPGGYRFIVDHKTHDRLTACAARRELQRRNIVRLRPSGNPVGEIGSLCSVVGLRFKWR